MYVNSEIEPNRLIIVMVITNTLSGVLSSLFFWNVNSKVLLHVTLRKSITTTNVAAIFSFQQSMGDITPPNGSIYSVRL